MLKDSRINLRIETKLKKKILDISEKYKIPISKIIVLSMIKYYKDSDNPEFRKFSKELQQSEDLAEIRLRNKEYLYRIYFCKNWQRRIYQIALSHLLLSNKINLPVIKELVKMAQSEFKLFPLRERKRMKPEMDNLKALLNMDYLEDRIRRRILKARTDGKHNQLL